MGIAPELKPVRGKYFICHLQKVYKHRMTIPLHPDRKRWLVIPKIY